MLMWNKVILLEGIVSIPMLVLAFVFFSFAYPSSAPAKVVYTCMCSLCPWLLTLARQIIALRILRQQQHGFQCLGTQGISSGLTVWYFTCIVMLCMSDMGGEATCCFFLFAINLLISLESHLCLPRQWLVKQETQMQVVASLEKYTACTDCFGTTCMICLEEFEEEISTVARLPCDHIFHTDCMEHWLRRDNRCPLRCAVKPAVTQPARHAPAEAHDEHLEVERVLVFI